MHKVLVAGAGKVGALIAGMLAESRDYDVHVADVNLDGVDFKRVSSAMSDIKAVNLDVTDNKALGDYLAAENIDALISSLPFYLNVEVAKVVKEQGCYYFDLTEDTSVTEAVRSLAEDSDQAFVPQCGLAPGFISIAANHLMSHFDSLETVKLRVGALPQFTNNALQYALTWSTEGLINQYGNPCHAIENGENVSLHPLEGLEGIKIDGLTYEAFNTSGGLGSLADSYSGKVRSLTYKTMRYPGHCEKMCVLMNDLKLNEDRDTLKRILEHAVPSTNQDVVIVYVSVNGEQGGKFIEENYMKKVYPQTIANIQWTAIQVTTAAGVCAVVDIVLNEKGQYQGLILQEDFQFEAFINNRFAKCYS